MFQAFQISRTPPHQRPRPRRFPPPLAARRIFRLERLWLQAAIPVLSPGLLVDDNLDPLPAQWDAARYPRIRCPTAGAPSKAASWSFSFIHFTQQLCPIRELISNRVAYRRAQTFFNKFLVEALIPYDRSMFWPKYLLESRIRLASGPFLAHDEIGDLTVSRTYRRREISNRIPIRRRHAPTDHDDSIATRQSRSNTLIDIPKNWSILDFNGSWRDN